MQGISNEDGMRFNRYIVECKGRYGFDIALMSPDLIDTLWNVKVGLLHIGYPAGFDLIDTLWNVKWHMDESRKHLLIKR